MPIWKFKAGISGDTGKVEDNPFAVAVRNIILTEQKINS